MLTQRTTLFKVGRTVSNLLLKEDLRLFAPSALRELRIRPTYTDGQSMDVGELAGGGVAAIFLDRFSGHIEPRFWFGFELPNRSRLRLLLQVAPKAGFAEPPRVHTPAHLVEERSFLRYRVPLQFEQFDQLVEDRTSGEYFLGIHYPRPYPLAEEAMRDVSRQAAQFVIRFASALDARADPTSSPWARPDRAIEMAAIRYVRTWLRDRHYVVHDRQRALCGYDLLAVRGGDELHVEVKGSSANERFFLTRHEWRVAQDDSLWRLFLVTNVVRRPPRLHQYTPRELEQRFDFDPLQWFLLRR